MVAMADDLGCEREDLREEDIIWEKNGAYKVEKG